MTESTEKLSWRRLYGVLWQVSRQRLDLLIPPASVKPPLPRWILQTLRKVLPEPATPRAQRVRDTFTALGPVYIKLGQLLSTRRDLIPPDIADELATLQDRVPPIPEFDVHSYVSEQLALPITEVFSELADEPLASASIAQVHAARLVSGEEVVVKIVRPGIRARIEDDMALIRQLAHKLNEHIPGAERLHLPSIASDHEHILLKELDMFSEARNQIQLRRNFADSDLLYVPKVHAEYTRDHVLVMERVYGIPISHIEALNSQQVNLKVLAHKGVETFFKQVFEHNFFHADMHPGNILINTQDPDNPKYIALDCAIIGSLTDADQNYLAQNLLAFFNRDYHRVVALHLESGWVPPETDPDEFERVIREVCEPIFAKPLAEISFAEFVIELFHTAGQFNMELQPQLVLLQKTLLYIEGLGRQLYPELDLWETAQPFMEQWAAQRLGPAAVITDWLNAGPGLWQQLSHLPSILHNSEADLRLLKSSVQRQHDSIARIEKSLQKQHHHRRIKQAAGAAFIAVSMWMLWQPIASGLSSGDMTMLAGVASALLGSALLVRA
jgi:ubiquinone biosynthesis protein